MNGYFMQQLFNYKTNFVPFYNIVINKGIEESDIRISSFLIQWLYGFDTAIPYKKRANSQWNLPQKLFFNFLFYCKIYPASATYGYRYATTI